MSIVTIAIVVLIIVVAAFVFFFNKERSKQALFLDNIAKKADGIFDIGHIMHVGEIKVSSQLTNGLISLDHVSRIYKYFNEQVYWIEFHLNNIASEDSTFNVDSVSVSLNNVEVKCDLILLFEKVPEYMAPPYGNRYYDTRYYTNYMLGPQAQRSFIFKAQFKPNDATPVFKESDSISINLSFKKLSTNGNGYIKLSNFTLHTAFKDSKFKKIQSIDETIQILGELP